MRKCVAWVVAHSVGPNLFQINVSTIILFYGLSRIAERNSYKIIKCFSGLKRKQLLTDFVLQVS